MKNVQWIPIKNKKFKIEGLTLVSECGNIIYFNGYCFRWDGHYYRGAKRKNNPFSALHRAIWAYHNGDIPEKHHIHHIDNNPRNNKIENLQNIDPSLHSKISAKTNKWVGSKENKEQCLKNQEKLKKWHKSEEGKKWHKQHGKNSWKNRKWYEYTCEICGKKGFTPYPTFKKLCSGSCRTKRRMQSGIDNVEKICPICNKIFMVNKYRFHIRKTCSRFCGHKMRKINA